MAVIGNTPSITLDEILVASDFTRASESALTYAQALAKRFASKLTVVNVVDLSVGAKTQDAAVGLSVDEVRHQSAENVERTVNQLTEAGVRAGGKTLEAHRPVARAVGLASEIGAGLLVVGANGRRGLNKFMLGSFSEGVIRHAKCPVLVVGPQATQPGKEGLSFATVLFATDLQHHSFEKAAIALAFAEESLARIFLFHVMEKPPSDVTDVLAQHLKAEAALRGLIPNAAYEWCNPETEIEYGEPASHILRFAELNGADLIVLGARRSAFWFTHFVQGVASKVIEKAKCPVMTICTE